MPPSIKDAANYRLSAVIEAATANEHQLSRLV